MRYLIALLALSACANSSGYKIYLDLTGSTFTSTSIALLELQMQSRNEAIKYGSKSDHDVIVRYITNADVANYNGLVLGLAWVDYDPCEIEMVERTYDFGQEWVNAVLWHEIGHCLGMDHMVNPDDIMHPYAKPLNQYSNEGKKTFFRRLYEATH